MIQNYAYIYVCVCVCMCVCPCVRVRIKHVKIVRKLIIQVTKDYNSIISTLGQTMRTEYHIIDFHNYLKSHPKSEESRNPHEETNGLPKSGRNWPNVKATC